MDRKGVVVGARERVNSARDGSARCTAMRPRLFGAEGFDWIYRGGAAGGEVAG